jgi:hypothetical protein
MAKPNYAFAKRQRDLARKAKQEEKRLKKAAKTNNQTEETPQQPGGSEKPATE